MAVGAESAANVDAKRLHLCDRLGDVVRIQSAREEDRYPHGVADLATHRPAVSAVCSAQFLGSERGIPGVEQNSIYSRRCTHRLSEGAVVPHVYHLNNSDSG